MSRSQFRKSHDSSGPVECRPAGLSSNRIVFITGGLLALFFVGLIAWTTWQTRWPTRLPIATTVPRPEDVLGEGVSPSAAQSTPAGALALTGFNVSGWT